MDLQLVAHTALDLICRSAQTLWTIAIGALVSLSYFLAGALVVATAGAALNFALAAVDIISPAALSAEDAARLSVGVWLLLTLAAFIPSAQDAVFRLRTGIRAPTAAENAAFEPAWAALCTRVGVDARTYLLRVSDKPGIAWACGQRVVVVSAQTLDFRPALLDAILAHELGHHRSAHALQMLLNVYFAYPMRTLISGLRVLLRSLRPTRYIVLIGLLFAPIRLAIWLLVTALGAALAIVDLLSLAYARRCEFVADRYAATHADPTVLADYLESLTSSSGRTIFDYIATTHPSGPRRARAIRRVSCRQRRIARARSQSSAALA